MISHTIKRIHRNKNLPIPGLCFGKTKPAAERKQGKTNPFPEDYSHQKTGRKTTGRKWKSVRYKIHIGSIYWKQKQNHNQTEETEAETDRTNTNRAEKQVRNSRKSSYCF